jgi:hypothetical protein
MASFQWKHRTVFILVPNIVCFGTYPSIFREAESPCKILVPTYQTAWHHTSEDINLYIMAMKTSILKELLLLEKMIWQKILYLVLTVCTRKSYSGQ